MEMEDHHNHNHHPQPQQYDMADLRQLMNGGARATPPHFPAQPTAADVFQPHHQYDMMMLGRQVGDVVMPPATASASTPPSSGLDGDTTGCLGGDASTGRWPRQETLTLLDIRSRLDPKFKDANHKGPLWDEVSRIMAEEHGYQRSGKKCREKFENLYKYYKKTKEGKAGRQDGKHYRFFRQLEALYGGNSYTSNSTSSAPEGNYSSIHQFHHHNMPSQTNEEVLVLNNKGCESPSLTNSTELETSSSDGSTEKGRKRRSGRWKGKIKEFMDSQMRKLIEKQEAWLERLVRTLEQKEKERLLREEEWRRQEGERLEREHKFWAKERAWIEARDAALMDALHKLAPNTKHHHPQPSHEDDAAAVIMGSDSWAKCEITRLMELRGEVEDQSSYNSEEVIWEQVATKMACFGYQRTASMCKHKWETITNNTNKRKDKSRTSNHNFYNNNIMNQQQSSSALYNQTLAPTPTPADPYCDINQQQQHTNEASHDSPSHNSNSNVGNALPADVSCFHFFLSSEGGENLWDNYGFKLTKGNQHH